MKEKIIDYIELLEAKARQNDEYYKERLELYVSNQEKDKQLEAYENMRKEAINKLKEHKKDLDYEPWSLYEVRGSILFNLLNILNKVGSDK